MQVEAEADKPSARSPIEAPDRRSPASSGSWRTRYIAVLVCVDMLAAVVAVVVCYSLRTGATVREVTVVGLRVDYAILGTLSLPLWLVSLSLAGAYRPNYQAVEWREYRSAVVVALRLLAIMAIGSFAFKADLSRSLLIIYIPTLIGMAVLGRWVMRRVLTEIRRRGRALIPLMLVGDRRSVTKFADHLFRERAHGYQVVGVCAPNGESSITTRGGTYPVVGTPDNLVAAARELGARSVAVAGLAHFENVTLQRVSWQLERSGIDLLVAPDVADLAGPRIRTTPLTGLPLLHITEPRVDSLARKLKAAIERTVAVPITLLASPLLLLVALVVLIDSGRPILYRQQRVGHKGRAFDILKFRTMLPEADDLLAGLLDRNEHDGALFKIRRDPRVTRVGRWLRKYSVDELPQLFNIIRGDMVFVGPRPCLPREMGQFGEAENRRFLSKPGMTGLWQVSGRSDLPWEDAVRCDLYYVENWSPFLDLVILIRTIRVVVAGRGC